MEWNVYDTSGIYIDTLQTVHGCDSVVTMDLTINYSFYAEESITACDSMTWDNVITYTPNRIYYDSLQTIAGCDSVYVDLTINPSPVFSFAQDAVGACGGDSVLLDAGLDLPITYGYRWCHSNYLCNASGTYSVTVGNGTPVSSGTSLSFDGIDDYVQIDGLSQDSIFTVSLWFGIVFSWIKSKWWL